MNRIPQVAVLVLVLVVILPCLSGGAEAAGESDELIQRRKNLKRSLCNTFGGCGVARSMLPNGAAYTFYKRQQKKQLAPPYTRSDGQVPAISAKMSPELQQQRQGPIDLVVHPPRIGKYVEDQTQYSGLRSGIRKRHQFA